MKIQAKQPPALSSTEQPTDVQTPEKVYDGRKNKFEKASSVPPSQNLTNPVQPSSVSNSPTKTVFQTLLSSQEGGASPEAATSAPRTGKNVAERLYKGRDLSITESERGFLDKGDLRNFWSSRLGKDPIARLGLALWGKPGDLKEGIATHPKEYWTPTANIASKAAMFFQAPSYVKVPPTSDEERLTYWTWMGSTTHERVDHAIEKEYPHLSPKEQKILVRKIGVSIAKAHAGAVDKDSREGFGKISGLLNPQQIADYHHAVFTSYDLPESTYGGTPYSFVPDFIELQTASGLYAHDADE